MKVIAKKIKNSYLLLRRILALALAGFCFLIFITTLFVESRYFARLLKSNIHRRLPVELGIRGDFDSIRVKFIPPGLDIRKPHITFDEKNILDVPPGLEVTATSLDATLQVFHLFLGNIRINAVNLVKAKIDLNLDEAYLKRLSQKQKTTNSSAATPSVTWSVLSAFHFRSVGLYESHLNVKVRNDYDVSFDCRELSIGRSTARQNTSFDLAGILENLHAQFPKGFDLPVIDLKQFQFAGELSSTGIEVRTVSMQHESLAALMSGKIVGDVLGDPKLLKSQFDVSLKGPLETWAHEKYLGRLLNNKAIKQIRGNIDFKTTGKFEFRNILETLDAEFSLALLNAGAFGWLANEIDLGGRVKNQVVTLNNGLIDFGSKMANKKNLARLLEPVEVSHVATQTIPLKLKLESVDLRDAVGPYLTDIYPVHLFVSGITSLRLSTKPDFKIIGDADFTINDFSFDNQEPNKKIPFAELVGLREAHLNGHYTIDKTNVVFQVPTLTLPKSKLSATGTIDHHSGKFDVDIKGPVNLTDVGQLAGTPIMGEGHLAWTIRGTLPDVVFDFAVKAIDASYLSLNLGELSGKIRYRIHDSLLDLSDMQSKIGKSIIRGGGTVSFDVNPQNKSDALDLKFKLTDGRVGDFSTLMAPIFKRNIPWYPYDMTGVLDADIKVSGGLDLNKLSVFGPIHIKHFEYNRERFRTITAQAGFRDGGVVAENIEAKKKSGFIRGHVRFTKDSILDYQLRSENFATSDIDHLSMWGMPFRSKINFSAEGLGKLEQLQSKLIVDVGEGQIKNVPFGVSNLILISDATHVKLDSEVFGKQLIVHFDQARKAQDKSSLFIQLNQFNLKPLFLILNPDLSNEPDFDSSFTGITRLNYAGDNLRRSTGEIRIEEGFITRHQQVTSLEKGLKIDVRDGAYHFSRLRLVSPEGVLEANADIGLNRIAGSIVGVLPLSLSELFVAPIDHFRGRLDVQATLAGSLDNPLFTARISSKKSELKLKPLEQPIEDLTFRGTFHQNILNFEELQAKFAGGLLKGRATANLHLTTAPQLQADVVFDNNRVKVYPVQFARVNGRLSVAGSTLPYHVSGLLKVDEALITENFGGRDTQRSVRTSKFMPQGDGADSGDFQLFNLDLHLLAERGILVRNDLLDVEVKGSINIVGPLMAPSILGRTSVTRGRLLFKDNAFNISAADVNFLNPATIDPEFNLSAQSDVRGYKINLVALGRSSDYRLNFQSVPPLSQNEIVSLLTLGIVSTGDSLTRNNNDASSRDELYGILVNQTGVTKGIQQKFGVSVRFDKSQVVGAESAFAARTPGQSADTTAPKVVLQKEVTKNLRAMVGTTVGVGEASERSAGLEYQLPFSPNLSILGTYQDQRGPQLRQSRTSVGADFLFKTRFR